MSRYEIDPWPVARGPESSARPAQLWILGCAHLSTISTSLAYAGLMKSNASANAGMIDFD